MANIAIATIARLRPSKSCGFPNVQRATVVCESRPIVPTAMPIVSEIIDLTGELAIIPAVSSKAASSNTVYSAAPNEMARSVSSGAIRTKPAMAKIPPTYDPMAEVARAAPARPCFAIW